VKETSFALTCSGPSHTARKPYVPPQQRIMQNRVDVCRLSESPANAAQAGPRGRNCAATKDFGNADQSDRGDNGTQSDGRSCVIHT